MSKNELRRYIILSVIFAVFSVIAFAAPFNKNAVFWISYLFGVIAIVFQVYVLKISFADGAETKSKFYGFPIARVGVMYMIAQLVISLIGMIAAPYIKTWIAVVINILPAALAVIGTVAADAAREEVERQEVKIKKDTTNMRSLQAACSALVSICEDGSLKKKLQDLTEEFKYSDPVSSDATIQHEYDLLNEMEKLKKYLTEKNSSEAEKSCLKITAQLKERNVLCARNK